MNRDQVLAVLQGYREELMGLGVESLSLVGSVAREESASGSDVDVVVSLSEGDRGLAHFRRLDELQNRLSEILGCRVDLVEEAAVSPHMRREIERDRVLAF
jgi:predicted nucleotidyltransferase